MGCSHGKQAPDLASSWDSLRYDSLRYYGDWAIWVIDSEFQWFMYAVMVGPIRSALNAALSEVSMIGSRIGTGMTMARPTLTVDVEAISDWHCARANSVWEDEAISDWDRVDDDEANSDCDVDDEANSDLCWPSDSWHCSACTATDFLWHDEWLCSVCKVSSSLVPNT